MPLWTKRAIAKGCTYSIVTSKTFFLCAKSDTMQQRRTRRKSCKQKIQYKREDGAIGHGKFLKNKIGVINMYRKNLSSSSSTSA